MLIRFTKMHGAGNDYIYLNGIDSCPANLSELAIKMSNRHKGIGSDGLVAIMKSDIADFRMRMFNADGSEGEMCGNASRCIGKYVYEKKLTTKKYITLETLSGIKTLSLDVNDDKVVSVTVDMGIPEFAPNKIPVRAEREIIKQPIISKIGNKLEITAVSMGNPHAVAFVDDLDAVDVHSIGREIESSPFFPNKTNVEFAQLISRDEIKMRVWERGSGETMACGTGACATVAAGVVTGVCDRKVLLHLLGGDIHITWDESNSHIYMKGDAVMVFEGEYEYQ